mgnify:CR=1 FL=1|jgi:hypothetical protein
MRLRQAAEMAIKAMDMDAKDADKISFERLAKIVVAGTALREALAQPESLRIAIDHYEQALKASWTEGAKGEAFTHWNEARKALLSAAPKPE